jgi:FkbM family methyltransferase
MHLDKYIEQIPLTKDDIVIDVGSHEGRTTEIFARSGATVYAFEPQPELYKKLKARFADKKNVYCFPWAAWTREETLTLFLNQDPNKTDGASLFASKKNVSEQLAIQVAGISLSSFIFDLQPQVRLLYINAEGAEYPLLINLEKTGAIHHIQEIVVSAHGKKIEGICDLEREALEVAKRYGVIIK